jgi:spore coat protein U-like protein
LTQAGLAIVLGWLAAATALAIDCTVATSGVAFGAYDATLASPTDSVGNITVRCNHVGGGAQKTSYTVALSAGSSGDFARRTMRAGKSTLDYNLFSSATRTQVWGNGSSGSTLVGGSLLVNPGKFTINEIVHPIYGRIPPQQSPEPGSYSDTVLITLSF